jgi:hypothetical protein
LFPAKGLKYINFHDPLRTLAGNKKDLRPRRLNTYSYFLFMNKEALGEFAQDKNISFSRLKAGCKRIANAKDKGLYGVAQELRTD